MQGLCHIYTGEGKGKTTAALGLALRAYGRGMQILYCQFLKSGDSGEFEGLALLKERLTIVKAPPVRGFLGSMPPEEREKVCREQKQLFDDVVNLAMTGEYDLVILDEAVVAYQLGVLPQEQVRDFIRKRPKEMELVLTGRDAPEELIGLADYVSEIKKLKHPYDQGVAMRKGIEY